MPLAVSTGELKGTPAMLPNMNRLLWILPVLLAVACGKSGSDDDGFGPGTPSALLPAAVAGDDFEVLTNAAPVTLNGSKSVDPTGGTLTFSWTQTAGTPVILSDPAVASPTFTAPATEEALTFQLAVTGAEGSDADSVTVTVKSLIVTAPDTWFVGYEKAGSIAATVSGGTGPYTFEWLGIEPWLNAAGAATPTLTFTTPKLTDFQNFPDVPAVALLKRSTQGRLQLTVRVTDNLGVVDEDLVNFSVGPFADTAANENVAMGEPAFLNGAGGTITSWTWSGVKPTGASISFFKPDKTALAGASDQRFVYFLPDVPGPYQVILTQNPGAVVKVIDITSGKYVGVGNLTGATPDPFKGECAACHAGQFPWLADFANPWKATGHAQGFETLLDPADPYHAAVQDKGAFADAFNFGSDYSIDSRTVGFSRITAGAAPNDGFAQMASADGFVLKGATWPDLVRKHPKTAAKANVQCESCHGPGSEHAGDTAGIRKSYDATLCGRCHSATHDLWETSSHGLPPLSAAGSASCNGCHSAQGYVVEMRAQEGAEPHQALFAFSNPNRPVIPADDRRGVTCQACHDPHKKTAKRPDGPTEPQLRAFGNVQFRNGAVSNAGEAAVCYTCHQSRTDTTPGSPDMNVRRAPHDSTAAEMLAGTNAPQFAGWTYNVSPHGIASKFLKTGQTATRQCLSCHADAQPAPGAVGFGALGGHTFRLKQGTGGTIAGDATHPGAATVAGTKKFTVASGASFLRNVFAGDTLDISAGADMGTYTVASVDGARQITLATGPAFGGGAVTAWTVTSVVKHNTAACTQCHATALDFQMAARADYDGDATIESVQDEIAGLRTSVAAAIDARLVSLIGAGTFHTIANGRVRYNRNGSGTLRTFPGPSVTASDNPDIAWTSLTSAQQAEWQTLYAAAYNIVFVTNDKSEGIHNTGYAVNLLQSSYQAVTGTAIGAAFAPFP
jgi:hypothetical protein